MEEENNFKAECVCGSTHFMQEDGKTFCMECQTELESAKEIVYEVNEYGPEIGDLTQRSRVLTTTVKKQAVKAQELPTSWECFNQILCNLVDEIEEVEDNLFGTVNHEFKLTVLQLWAAYLRCHGKAFFSKDSAAYPRFNSQYNILDAEIIYKIKRPKVIRHMKRKRKVISNARARKRNIRTIKKRANQLELSKQKSPAPIETTKPAIPFQFTPLAKKCLRTLMSEEHLKEHEDNPTLTCHKYRYTDMMTKEMKPEEITRTKLYVLLFMALNHVESDIQLADLIRFLREGHVTLQITTSVSNNARYNLDFFTRIQKGCTYVPKHCTLLTLAYELAKEIGFKFKDTDLSKLCKRYLQDLCLPPEIGNLIDVILHACPPTVGEGDKRKNYEARAMAFILFTLKLLFGLDDSREYLISSSGREINKKISALSLNNDRAVKQKQLFIWCDWVEYIEMRNIILLQLHCPTAMKSYAHSDGMTAMYLECLAKSDEKNAEVKSTFKSYAKLMQHVRDQFQATYNVHPKLTERIAFYPSLTPNRSYMEEVRLSGQSDIFVPTFMDVAHDEREIEPFLNPSKLQSFFRQHRVKLAVNKLKCNADIDEPYSATKSVDFEQHDYRFGSYCFYDFGITTQKWVEQLNDRKASEAKRMPKDEGKKSVDLRLNAIIEYNRIAKEKKRKAAEEVTEKVDDALQTDSSANIFDCVSTDEDEEDNVQPEETLDFTISNSDYWIIFNSINSTKNEATDFRKNLSKTFQWLLKQGADLIENKETDLYCELMVIEYYFTKDVKPSNIIFDSLMKRYGVSFKMALCNSY